MFLDIELSKATRGQTSSQKRVPSWNLPARNPSAEHQPVFKVRIGENNKNWHEVKMEKPIRYESIRKVDSSPTEYRKTIRAQMNRPEALSRPSRGLVSFEIPSQEDEIGRKYTPHTVSRRWGTLLKIPCKCETTACKRM